MPRRCARRLTGCEAADCLIATVVIFLRSMKFASVILGLVCAVAWSSEAITDMGKYQVILDRMPFGEEPTPESIAAAAAQAQPPRESFTKNLKMCALTRNFLSGKVQVGLTDAVSKKSYFLGVGESEDGIDVVEVDYDREKALLRRGGEEAWMGMNDVSQPVTAAPPVVASTRRGPRPAAAAATPGRPAQKVVREVKNEKPKLSGEALTKHLQDYQMDLIRAGGDKGPPLPMELTPEMDAQLVAEGVLPPLE